MEISKKITRKASNVIYNSLWITKAIAILLEPIMPFKAEAIYEQLGKPRQDVPLLEALTPIEFGTKINKPVPLFQPVPDEEIEALQEAMVRRIARAER
jgi:methionyl-tRNA synthetase